MARRRFGKLPRDQQEAILSAALEEFAAHGFHDASLNRVIAAAGISKGSMYYHFDGKEDLYAHVLRVEFEKMITEVGPFDVPTVEDRDAYWATLERYYLQLMTGLGAAPQFAALVRGWIAGSMTPTLQQIQEEMERAVVPWVEGVLEAGQQIGAVRSDLPTDFLITITLSMGQAMDIWLLTRPDATDLPKMIRTLIDMMRRALEPVG